MKCTRRLVGDMAVVLLVAALCGCGKLSSGLLAAERTGSVEIVVENPAAGVMRTIAPAQLTVGQLTAGQDYTLKLTGTTGRKDLPERELTLTNGRGILSDIPEGLWELTLTAYRRVDNVAVLQGKALHKVEAMTVGNVAFTLTPLRLFGSGTGTVSLTVNLNPDDLALMQSDKSKRRSWRIGLYTPGTDIQVPGSLAEWNRDPQSVDQTFPSTIAYSGGSLSAGIPAGEYNLRIWMSGGGLRDGVTLSWSDNLYVEPGRQTAATITMPRLAHKPTPPTGFWVSSDSSGSNAYMATFRWDEGGYNTEGFELETRMGNTGSWSPPGLDRWNRLTGGSTQVHSPGDVTSYSVTLNRSGNARNRVAARVRAVSATSYSEWTYLPCLAMPSPLIVSARNAANGGKRRVYVRLQNVNYETNYQLEYYILRGAAAGLFSTINGNDPKWDLHKSGAGSGNTGSTQTNGSNSYANNSLTPEIAFPGLASMDPGLSLCIRVRAISSNGYEGPWTYYSQPVSTGP